MNNVLIKSYSEPPVNQKEILRYAMCKEADKNVNSLLHECLNELNGKLTYKVCYIKANTNEYFKHTKSSLLEKYLSDCDDYIIFAATIGIETDRLIMKYSRFSPAKAHMFQAIGTERIEALCDIFENDIRASGNNSKPRISPGYGDMPLEMQQEIFSILNCPKNIGLTLNDSMLMSPTKSVTAFIGVSK